MSESGTRKDVGLGRGHALLADARAEPLQASGTCHAIFAYDIGLGMRLEEAAALATRLPGYRALPERRPAPPYLDFKEVPLRIVRTESPIGVGRFATSREVEVVLFAFGAVSVTYRIQLTGPFTDWVSVSGELYESPALRSDSRDLVHELARGISSAVSGPDIAEFVEDYHIFHVASVDNAGGQTTAEIVASNRQTVAQILRAEKQPLGSDEVADALGSRVAYGEDDDAFVGWNGAVLIRQPDLDDVRSVLEYANVALLKLRRLDDRLDGLLDRAYSTLARREEGKGWRWGFPLFPDRETRLITRFQMESARLYEAVSNALKLVGDPYLARLYRLAAGHMRLSEWDASITRKLQTANSIFEKLTERTAIRRLEVLEWIIIVLIAISTLMVLR